MKKYIKQLLRENLLSEEFNNGILYGYHVTSLKNWKSIKQSGLNIGHRQMQGKGLYAFYDYNHAIRYGMKGEVSEPIIVKFEITTPKRFLILNMDIAKEILGSEYHLINQIENYFYGGLDAFYNEYVKLANPSMTIEQLKVKLNDIENDTYNSKDGQKHFVFDLIPRTLSDRLNIIWDGNYGLEFRINNLRYVKVLSYKSLFNDSEETITILDKIPDNEEFKPLVDFIKQNSHYDTLDRLRKLIDDARMNARNTHEWDYYEELLKLIDKIK
jgi:hypothetical protein